MYIPTNYMSCRGTTQSSSLLGLPVKFSEFDLAHLGHGTRMVKSKLYALLGTGDYITLRPSLRVATTALLLLWRKQVSVTVECPHLSNGTTWRDKLRSCDSATRSTWLLKMLVAELIGRGKVLSPFYVGRSKEDLKKWWLHTATDSHASVANYWSTSLDTTRSDSWFSMKESKHHPNKNSQRTYSLLRTYSAVNKWVEDDTVERAHAKKLEMAKARKAKSKYAPNPKEGVVRAQKVKLHLTCSQKDTIKNWMGVARLTYNKAVHELRKRNPRVKKTFKDLRAAYVTEKRNPHLPEWVFNTPKDVRANALQEAVEGYKSNMTKMMKAKEAKKPFKFKLRYRKKKAMHQNISIPASAVSIVDDQLTIYPKYGLGAFEIRDHAFKQAKKSRLERERRECELNELKMTKKKRAVDLKALHESIPEQLTDVEGEIKIMHSKPDGWHAVLCYRVKPPPRIADGHRVCALDPGLCTFLAGCDTDGKCFTLGEKCFDRLKSRFTLISRLRSRCDELRKNGRAYRKANERVRLQFLKQSYAIDDLHLKCAKYLTDRYDIIILPHFCTSQMIQEHNRMFNRKLLALAHYKFRMRLQAKCEATGKTLVIVNESYTSKTCSDCGLLNYHLGGSRTFKCPHCALVLDRDINASINILHKSITKR